MKKRRCELCTKNKARRECRIKGKFICSLCCANLRHSECEGCRYFQAVTYYQSSKSKKLKQKPFIIEINEEVEDAVDNALIFVEKGRIGKGRVILEELIRQHPENHMVNYGLGVVYAFEEQFDEAIKFFSKATDIFPYFVEAHFNKAMAYKSKLDLKNAIKSFQEVVEVGDAQDELVQQAKNLIRNIEELVLKANKISLEKYFEAQEKFERAYSDMEDGKWEKAMAGFRECLAINDRHPQSYGNIGLCLAQLGRKADALTALDTALEIDPEYAPAIVNRTVINTLEEGKKLPQEKFVSLEYYKDLHSAKRSLI